MTDAEVFAERRNKLRAILQKDGFDAFLVSHAANRYYLSGFELHDPQFNESAGRLLIMADGQDILCTDARYTDAAKRIWSQDQLLIYTHAASDIAAYLTDYFAHHAPKIAFESAVVNVDFYEHLFNNNTFYPVGTKGIIENLRMYKDATEIAKIDASCRLNEELMQWLPSILAPGRNELDIAWDIEVFFRQHGATETAFASIVAHGKNAALPHAIPAKDAILDAEDLLLADIGCRLDDYCSDQTRTFWVGQHPSQRFQKTLALVQEAQTRGIEKIRPGAVASDVYNAARGVFIREHVAHECTHALGHGVGLETHEEPSLNRKSEQVLAPGMVVTVEPGLYDASWGGIRWEHMVLVTEKGHRILGKISD